jgi:mannose-6-phosphate isomerase-like protein (cupin superfamily)
MLARDPGPVIPRGMAAPLMVEKIEHAGSLLCLIIRSNYAAPGISFFTPADLSQQLAYMRHPAGKQIEPHVHNPVPREVHYTQEVLFIKRGRLRVDLYDDQQNYLESRLLGSGDVILLATGGHGFEVLEETQMVEVKQGPYPGEEDKTRFPGITRRQIRLRGPQEKK